MEGVTQQMQELDVDGYDVIKKPRTQFSSNVLRRAIPKMNAQDKVSTMSMNGLNMLSALRLNDPMKSNASISNPKAVFSVSCLPRMISLDSKAINKNILADESGGPTQANAGKQEPVNKKLAGISEGSDSEGSSDDNEDRDDSGSGSDESSIDLDEGNDMEKMYQDILQNQSKAKKIKDAKNKGEHLDDLVDQEMIELLNVCYRLHMPSMESIRDKCYNMGPRDGNKKVLILDMDETMLHARFIESDEAQKADDGDFFFTLMSATSGSADVQGNPSSSLKVSIKMRPYLDMTLDYLAKFYEICVFTAGTQDYADAALDFIDPDRLIIKHRLYRQHCVNPIPGVYVKDLRIITDRDLKDIVLVDNSIISFAYQMDNGIPIKAYMRQDGDEELLYMVTFLEELFGESDLRNHLRKNFCLKKLQEKYCYKV